MNTIKLLLISLGLCGLVLESKAQDLLLASTLKRVKLAKAKEISDSFKTEVGTVPVEKQQPQVPESSRKIATTEPLFVPENPMLTGIFGVNDELRAVISYKGETVSLSNEYRPKGLGLWAYGYVLPEGVLLSVAPLNLLNFKKIAPTLQGSLNNKPVCQLLNLPDKQCLLLVPVSLPQRDPLTGKAGAFQAQVRSLITQQVPPMNYSAPTGLSVGTGALPPSPSSSSAPSSSASAAEPRESTPSRTGRLPR